MGVKGFHKVLLEEGWLPDDEACPCCSTSLWRHPNSMQDGKFASRVSLVNRRSTLFIDGAGLCFYLHRIAYARHTAEVLTLSPGRRKSSANSPCSAKHLKPQQVTKLLPNLLPLSKIDEVAREFVDTLKNKHHLKLIVYFDGELRREAKRETDKKRQLKRPVEWSALQQYCCNGIMPAVDRVCQWENQFPKGRLFISQVKHSLRQQQIEIVVCEEEADAELARQASRTPNSYVVGMDTDFCFFEEAQYLPLSTLHANGSVVTACVISRKALAESLHLPDEQAMVELSILMGNDYVGTSSKDRFDFSSRKPKDIMDHLRASGKGYRVSSTSGVETGEAMSFARAFYNLKDLDNQFPLFELKEKAQRHDVQDEVGSELVMSIPSDFPDHLAVVQPHDISLVGTVLRCLQAYLDQIVGEEGAKSMARREHLEALKMMSLYQQDDSSVAWRPAWEDIPACYLIESCVAYIIKRSGGSPLVRLSPPAKIFDAQKFHNTLFKLRNQGQLAQQPQEHVRSPPKAQNSMKEEKKMESRVVLPIDEHEERIIEAISRNRVTIIQGETGCGKSSRVPIMIMKAAVPDGGLKEVKLFISQPRRIAAKALVERLRSTEPELGQNIALRMGHGVREYENSATRAWFVTTGYLVRLLANHPETFKKVSHLVIDEIHERSVDTDVLCLLCRRLIHTNPHIRLVLMSATLAAAIYEDYFNIAEPTIKVGARRFEIKEVFVEELPEALRLPPRDIKAVRQIENECIKTRCIAAPSNSTMECFYNLASRIAITVGKPGSSVLIFVPGMKDIESISEIIERLYVPGVRYTVVPIHSDLPLEDQAEAVFGHTAADEVRVFVATNSAESSITLPDCDHVICTGLQKQITYNASSHRQMLSPCWISRASAQQRSGRVGRVRPGTVFRLYTREAYNTMMKEFESGEMLRMPLDSVILMLKEILNEDTTPALLNCLEPPDLSTIERSYSSLHKSNYISQANDTGKITVLGAFVSALGIDLALGALIGLGIQFGVGAEAIEMAAVLSFPKTPWLLSNPLVHKPQSFNAGTAKTFASRNQFDAAIFSEPLATMNLIHEYSRLQGSRLSKFCQFHGVHNTRIRRLISTKKNLVSRVADFVKIDASLLKVSVPPSRMHHSKLTILRVIQVWLFHECIIEYNPLPYKSRPDGSFTVGLKTNGAAIEEEHLANVLRRDRHFHSLKTSRVIEQAGGVSDEEFDIATCLLTFENRFVSYAIEKEVDLAWFWFEHGLQLYVLPGFDVQTFRKLWDDVADEMLLRLQEVTGGRGRGERACGRWTIQDPQKCIDDAAVVQNVTRYRLRDTHFNLGNGISSALRARLRKSANIGAALSFDFSKNTNRRKRGNVVFQIFVTGCRAFKVTHTDLCDLLAIPKLKDNHYLVDKHERRSQYIHFHNTDNQGAAASLDAGGPVGGDENAKSSSRQPLLRDAPEGARLLAVLAASRRREQTIQIPLPNSAEETDEANDDDDQCISFSLENGLSKMQSRWTRLNTDKAVFVFENSVPASVIPVHPIASLYACCANTLDLRGGGLRAEGLTLLPPGSLFLLLSLLAFGLIPEGLGQFPTSDEEVDECIVNCLAWIKRKDASEVKLEQSHGPIDQYSRIKMAIDFSRSCVGLGERLVLFPDRTKALCELFESEIWQNLEGNPFFPTPDHVRKNRDGLLASLPRPGSSYGDAPKPLFDGSYPRMQDESGRLPMEPPSRAVPGQSSSFQECAEADDPLRGTEVTRFSDEILSTAQQLFGSGEAHGSVLPSTNILALCIKQYFACLAYESFLQPDRRQKLLAAVERFGNMRLNPDFWIVHRYLDRGGKDWFLAQFVDASLPLKSRGTRGMARWLKYDRPWTIEHANECIPPVFRDFEAKQMEVLVGDEKRRAILFATIEDAVRMEAAFCLERMFSHSNKRWYEQSFQDLMQQMYKRAPSISEVLKRLDAIESK